MQLSVVIATESPATSMLIGSACQHAGSRMGQEIWVYRYVSLTQARSALRGCQGGAVIVGGMWQKEAKGYEWAQELHGSRMPVLVAQGPLCSTPNGYEELPILRLDMGYEETLTALKTFFRLVQTPTQA